MLAAELLEALVAHENEKPRAKQFTLGPSELGGCREYIRNVWIGSPRQENSEWPTAAVVGTLLGEHLEAVASQYLDAVTQVPVTTTLPNGLLISGTADMVFPGRNLVADAKSKDKLLGVRKEGASLENLVQVSVYALGLVQQGILSEGATASLIYADRSGMEQSLHEVELPWESIQNFVQLAVDRLTDVEVAQEHIDAGEVEWVHALRDKTPPFCYSPRVMCPFRDLCWKGSEWVPNENIDDEEIARFVERYAEARDTEKEWGALRLQLREQLRGLSGKTPSGLSVNWSGERLYVTRVR